MNEFHDPDEYIDDLQVSQKHKHRFLLNHPLLSILTSMPFSFVSIIIILQEFPLTNLDSRWCHAPAVFLLALYFKPTQAEDATRTSSTAM